MSTVPSYFKDFLSNIRLTDNQVNDLKTGHTTLRKRLEEDETLSKIIVSTFLQGSYRRSTAVKPKNGNKSDVDVIVVTKLDSEEYTPEEALRQHRTIAEASAVESPIRQETIGFPAHFFTRAHNFKPPGRACQPEADSPMRT